MDNMPGIHLSLVVNDRTIGKLRAAGVSKVDLGGVSASVYHHARIHWDRCLSISLLTGVPISSVLHPSYVLLKGEHLPLSSPILGVASASLAAIHSNPCNLSYVELFGLLFPKIRL